MDAGLEKALSLIKRMGGHPVVKEAASFMDPKYKMIVVYLDGSHARLYQVQIYDTAQGNVVASY